MPYRDAYGGPHEPDERFIYGPQPRYLMEPLSDGEYTPMSIYLCRHCGCLYPATHIYKPRKVPDCPARRQP